MDRVVPAADADADAGAVVAAPHPDLRVTLAPAAVAAEAAAVAVRGGGADGAVGAGSHDHAGLAMFNGPAVGRAVLRPDHDDGVRPMWRRNVVVADRPVVVLLVDDRPAMVAADRPHPEESRERQ